MISTAGPAASITGFTGCSREARVPAWSARMVVAVTELTVGAAAAGFQTTVTEFRLLANVELAGAVVRDQPSGTFTRRCPAADRYGTSTGGVGVASGGVVSG